MKKLNRLVNLLWKSHKREHELKKEIEELKKQILQKDDDILIFKYDSQKWKSYCDDLEKRLHEIKSDSNLFRFRIVRPADNPYMMPPMMDEDIVREEFNKCFKNHIKECKINFVDQLIKEGFVFQIDTNEYVEWQLNALKY